MQFSSLLLILLLALSSFQFLNSESWAETDKQKTVEPIIYDSGIILMNIGELNEIDGQYWLDFFFYIKSDKVDFTQNIPELVFMNARDIELGDPHITQNYYEIRVKGQFFTQLDFYDYPYEKHMLVVEIEPKIPYDKTRFVFGNTPETHIDPDLGISSNLKMIDVTSESVTHTYFDGLEFSRMISTFVVGAEPVGTTLRTVLPVTIIVGISLTLFFIPGNFIPRLIIIPPLLLATVFWHQTDLQLLPNLGYMTTFDRLMLMYYALFVNNILSLVVQIRASEIYEDQNKVKKYNRFFIYTTIAIIVIGVIRLFTV